MKLLSQIIIELNIVGMIFVQALETWRPGVISALVPWWLLWFLAGFIILVVAFLETHRSLDSELPTQPQ